MPNPKALTHFVELLHNALKAQIHFDPDRPITIQSLESALSHLSTLLKEISPLVLTFSGNRIQFQGMTVEGAPNAAQFLSREMISRGIHGVAFHRGFDRDELQRLLFVLQLQPYRLNETGGPKSLLPEKSHLRFITEGSQTALPQPAPEPTIETSISAAPSPLPSPTIPEPPDSLAPPTPIVIQTPALTSQDALVNKTDSGVQVQPQQLADMGGPASGPSEKSPQHVETEDNQIAQVLSAPEPTIETSIPAAPSPLPSPTIPEPPDSLAPPSPILIQTPAPTSQDALIGETDSGEQVASQKPLPTPTVLASDLKDLFSSAVKMTAVSPTPNLRVPWSPEQREIIMDSGFLVPDFTGLMDRVAPLELERIDSETLRGSLRSALSSLDPMIQGAVILGLPSFPSKEQALRRALDYLAPELLAQAIGEAFSKRYPSMFELALLAAGFLTCVKDRDLSLEAICGRLRFEDWTIEDLNILKEAILWECHGMDTKLRMSLEAQGLFGLKVQQVAILNRQLLKSKRSQDIKNLLDQLEKGFISPESSHRRHSAEIIADLTNCLGNPAILPGIERQIFKMLHRHIETENDQQAMHWSCHAMETLLGHWFRKQMLEVVKKEMQALGDLGFSISRIPKWKAQAIRDLLLRISSPSNMETLTEQLYSSDNPQKSQLQDLLTFLGRPAAEYLVNCLKTEKDKHRRGCLFSAIRAIGIHAIPALKEALSSPEWFMVRNAIQLLSEIRHKGVFDDVALAMEHRDARVRKAAIRAVSLLGEKAQAAEAIAKILANPTINTQLECLVALGDLKSPVCVPAILTLLENTKPKTEESSHLRVRAVETLGLIGAPEAVLPLLYLFDEKGSHKRESTSIRLSAAKSLAAINTPDSREAIALALEFESQEEVRIILRQYLEGDVCT